MTPPAPKPPGKWDKIAEAVLKLMSQIGEGLDKLPAVTPAPPEGSKKKDNAGEAEEAPEHPPAGTPAGGSATGADGTVYRTYHDGQGGTYVAPDPQ